MIFCVIFCLNFIERNFRIIDDDGSQTLDFNEFKKATKDFRFGLNDDEIEKAFVAFDINNNGKIDYDEFIRTIRGEMNDYRKQLVEQVFNVLDVNGNGYIELEEFKSKYNARNHPDVKSGRRSEDEVLLDFLETFENTYNYICGTENDGKVTLEEFMEYYENVSMTIDNDEYFEIMINNGWNLNQNKYNKGWSNKDEEKELNKKNLNENYVERFGNRRPGQTEEEAKEEKVNTAFKKFKKEIISRGCDGLISLNKQFKQFDENNSKTLDYEEFVRALKEYKINLDDEEILQLFNLFDENGNGIIEYEKFIKEVK